MGPFIRVRSAKFQPLPGEADELVNEGLYGKALAQYLQTKLTEKGRDVSGIGCEDWGWLVGLTDAPFPFGVCIHCEPEQEGPLEFAVTDSMFKPRVWSWKKFGLIDTTQSIEKLHGDLMAIFRDDPEVTILGVSDEL